MRTKTNNIVADGRERLLADPDTQERIAEAIRHVRGNHRPQWEQAGIWKKLWLRWKMRREIRREIEKIAPSTGLYFAKEMKEARNNRAEDVAADPPNPRP